MKQKYISIRARLLLFTAFIVATLLSAPQSTHALGISPSAVSASSVLRGAAQTKQVEIIRGQNDLGQLTIQVSVRGDASDYIILSEEEITMPDGVSSLTYPFEILPDRLANGSYSAKLDFLVQPQSPSDEESGLGAALNVVTGVTLPVNFTVTGEEIVEFDIFNLGVRDTEVSQPIFITYSVTNSGNVSWRPDTVDFIFTNVDDPAVTVTRTVTAEEMEYVSPGVEASIVSHELHEQLTQGAYALKAIFYYKDEVVEELEFTSFNVYPEGSLQQDGELRSITTNKTSYSVGEKIKLDAVFENTGQVSVKGVLITEIYKNEELIDVIRGKEQIIDKGQKATFSEVITGEKPGQYTLSSYVEYGFKRTDTSAVRITVVGDLLSTPLYSFLILIAISILIIAIAIFYRHFRIKTSTR